MTHIHVPDGVLPVWLWLAGWALSALLLGLASFAVRKQEREASIPLLGAVSALMLVAMSLEIVPLAYHVNLTVIAGALLGPWLGLVAAFVVSLMLALLGHGGLTVVGLNAALLGAEVVLGWALFRGLSRLLGGSRTWWAGAAATVLTLAVTTGLLIGVIALAGEGLSVGRFTAVIFTLGPLGWVLEALITGSVLAFVARVRPGLLL